MVQAFLYILSPNQFSGYIDIVRILLDNNVDVNSKGGGATPLSEATRLCNSKIKLIVIY